jgi:hypothetical protein
MEWLDVMLRCDKYTGHPGHGCHQESQSTPRFAIGLSQSDSLKSVYETDDEEGNASEDERVRQDRNEFGMPTLAS